MHFGDGEYRKREYYNVPIMRWIFERVEAYAAGAST
jgi:hypothetical protein